MLGGVGGGGEGGGSVVVLLALLAVVPSVIFSFFTKNRRLPHPLPLDLPLNVL